MGKDQEPRESEHQQEVDSEVFVPLSRIQELIRRSPVLITTQKDRLAKEIYLAAQNDLERPVSADESLGQLEEALGIEDELNSEQTISQRLDEIVQEIQRLKEDETVLLGWLQRNEKELAIDEPDDELQGRLSELAEKLEERGKKEDEAQVYAAIGATLGLLGLRYFDLSPSERLQHRFLIRNSGIEHFDPEEAWKKS